MAFRINGSAVNLEFGTGTLLAGAHVRCSLDMRLRDYLALQDLFVEDLPSAIDLFATTLITWDIEDEDGPVPATADGIRRLPMAALFALYRAWVRAVSASDPNSRTASASGSTSEAERGQTEA